MRTLTIDIGGTGIKMLALDADGRPVGERVRELTPKPATPAKVLRLIGRMLEQQGFDRVSVGFPGVVIHGVVRTAPNLASDRWRDYDIESALAALTGKPTRVINDADLLGYGVIEGKGIELVVTLGTGFGTALYVDGHLVPNLELAHHPFLEGKTYEQLISDKQLKRIGRKAWCKRVARIFEVLDPVLNYDVLHVGGGNAAALKEPLPVRARLFGGVEGMTGGVRLWADSRT